ncbi:MAG: 30S ribosomal protein S13 [Candidatus Hadarchaeota archaeon]
MPEKEQGEKMKGIVRLAGRDLNGSLRIQPALTNLKGVGSSLAKAIVRASGLEGTRKVGTLSDEKVEDLEKVLEDPIESGIPKWMVNRRKDYESGEDLHIIGGDIDMLERQDITREKNIQSRRGIRHQRGLPVRGQRTRSTGRSGMSVGVEREKLREKEEE